MQKKTTIIKKNYMKIKDLLTFWFIVSALFFSFNAASLFLGEFIELKSKVISKTKNKHDERTIIIRNEYGSFTITENSLSNSFNKEYDNVKYGDSITSKQAYVNWYSWALNEKTKNNIIKLYNSSYVTENMNVHATATMFIIFFIVSCGFLITSIAHFIYCLCHVLSSKVSLFK